MVFIIKRRPKLSFRKFGFVKLDYFCNKNNNINNNKQLMLLNAMKKIS